MAKIKLSDLSCEYVDAQTMPADWERVDDEHDEGAWESWECSECEECGAKVLLSAGGGQEKHRHVDPESDCSGHVPLVEGPMMNYFYACDWERYTKGVDDAAARIAHLPLCLVQRGEGERGLGGVEGIRVCL